jgi:hypothetical protein
MKGNIKPMDFDSKSKIPTMIFKPNKQPIIKELESKSRPKTFNEELPNTSNILIKNKFDLLSDSSDDEDTFEQLHKKLRDNEGFVSIPPKIVNRKESKDTQLQFSDSDEELTTIHRNTPIDISKPPTPVPIVDNDWNMVIKALNEADGLLSETDPLEWDNFNERLDDQVPISNEVEEHTLFDVTLCTPLIGDHNNLDPNNSNLNPPPGHDNNNNNHVDVNEHPKCCLHCNKCHHQEHHEIGTSVDPLITGNTEPFKRKYRNTICKTTPTHSETKLTNHLRILNLYRPRTAAIYETMRGQARQYLISQGWVLDSYQEYEMIAKAVTNASILTRLDLDLIDSLCNATVARGIDRYNNFLGGQLSGPWLANVREMLRNMNPLTNYTLPSGVSKI